MSRKTNALRILEDLHIAHRVIEYEVDESDLSAAAVAAKVGMECERVFKTLAARTDLGKVVLFCVPGDLELDLKKAARAAEVKSVAMLNLKDLQPVTGYIRGGCSPLGAKKAFPVYIDETARLFEEISVSAGARGMQVVLAPEDLARACGAAFADLT
jgi:Cys-tRNA(Pro)/Cys-tRNA(Cys) deacylase